MARPTITLTTDFGLADHFVSVMKGVILRICPEAEIVDISHQVEPFEIAQGAFLLAQAYRYFPAGTVHVAVVDPGVGSSRRPILVDAGGHRFVGPDNGVLSMVYQRIPHQARAISAEQYFLQPVSRTFHGRDIFAPVAAHLASGVPSETFGEPIEDHLKTAFNKPQRTAKRVWSGVVLHVDRFGNLITNFHIEDFSEVEICTFELAIGTRRISKLVTNYAQGEIGEPAVIIGSSGYLEVVANQSSAARALGCGPGAPCDLGVYPNA